MSEPADSMEYIAVVGMAGRFPGASDVNHFWDNLERGVESISRFTNEELSSRGVPEELQENPNYVKAGAVLDNADRFDAAFFGYSAREAEMMDPQQRVLLEIAWEALESAGYNPETYDGAIGVFAGTSGNDYRKFLPGNHKSITAGVDSFEVMVGNDPDFLTTRISYKLNLKGPSLTIQTACSSSLVAVHQACQHLLTWQCDMALAGGVCIRFPQGHGYLYQEGMIWSPDGHCRPFDSRARGTVFSNGAGLVVLKRLSDALAEHDSILAVIRGSAINNDGAMKVGFTAPSVEGQREVIATALALGEVEVDSIGYVEAHGTGTPLGDPIEVEALTAAFREHTERTGFCVLGSVKSNIGHLDAAAGVAGLIKAVLALQHKKIPATLHFSEANPNIDFAASPFHVNSALLEWESRGSPRRAGVSSFGVGGTNAHVVLEEAPECPLPPSPQKWQLLPVSARSGTSLQRQVDNLVRHLTINPEVPLADAAWTLQQGRKRFKYRSALVVRSGARDTGSFAPLPASAAGERDIVFMFSGQGSQHVNMGLGLYEGYPMFREEMDRCSEILTPYLGLDVRDILYPPESGIEQAANTINQTAVTQPALFVLEFCLAKLWNHFGVFPGALVGHSIGEYTAACIAGVFSLEDALQLVAARGRLMQSLPPGSMLALPLSAEDVEPYLDGNIALAVVNSASMSVVSGEKQYIDSLAQELESKGIEGRILHTSHAFHSPMMEPILDEFAREVESVARHSPRIPFVSNLTGTWITEEQAVSSSYWARHLRRTVNFFANAGELLNRFPNGVMLEVGPGQTLTMMTRQHPSSTMDHLIIPSARPPIERKDDVQCFLAALGRLWAGGCEIDWEKLHEGEPRRRVALPTYPFERKRYWLQGGEPEITVPGAGAEQPGLTCEKKQQTDTGGMTEMEQTIARIWQSIIPGLEGVSPSDSFHDLGGESLQAVQMLAEIEKQTGVAMLLGDFEQAPVLKDLALLVERKKTFKKPADGPVQPQRAGDSSFYGKIVKGLRSPFKYLPHLLAFLRGTQYIIRYRLLRKNVKIQFPFFAHTKVDICGPGAVRIGRWCGAYSNGLEHLTIMTTNEDTSVEIGEKCDLAGLTIRCRGNISLGDRVLTARNLIQDFFLTPECTEGHREGSIQIADDTWLAMQSTVLSGSTIGKGAALAALAVAYRAEIPEGSLASGNPVCLPKHSIKNRQ